MDNTGASTTSKSSSSSTRTPTPTPTQEPTWPDRLETLSHILTHQTLAPCLHSQFFVSLRVPCFLEWAFPPFLCPNPASLRSWSRSFFLSRASRFNLPHTSWRSRCPFQQPPPCILSAGVDPAPDSLGPQERREYATKRIRRGRFGLQPPEFLLFIVPNIALLSLVFLFDPLWRWPPRPT